MGISASISQWFLNMVGIPAIDFIVENRFVLNMSCGFFQVQQAFSMTSICMKVNQLMLEVVLSDPLSSKIS